MKRVEGIVLFTLLGACVSAPVDPSLRGDAAALFGELRPAGPLTPEQELGRALFWDEALSLDGRTSCGTCHFAADWGADRRRFSPDARGALTSRHSPTVFNSMGQ